MKPRKSKRTADLADFKNLRFIARISIEKSKDPAYDDKNKLVAVTPDHEAMGSRRADSGIGTDGAAGRGSEPAHAAAPAKPAQAVARPEWAQG